MTNQSHHWRVRKSVDDRCALVVERGGMWALTALVGAMACGSGCQAPAPSALSGIEAPASSEPPSTPTALINTAMPEPPKARLDRGATEKRAIAAGGGGAALLASAIAAPGPRVDSTATPAAMVLGSGSGSSAVPNKAAAPPAASTPEESGAARPPSETAPSTAVQVARDPWTWGDSRGWVLRTRNYDISTSITDEGLLRDLPRLMEAALLNYASALGELPKPTRPMRSMIFDKRSEWAAYTKRKLPQEANTYLAIGRGGYTTGGESVLFNLGRPDTFVIAVHEGWHQYTQSVFKDRLPTWLEEGVACWMEGHRFRRDSGQLTFMPWRNLERFGALRDAVREERLVPLKEILAGTPQEALGDGKATLLGYYAQVWALVQFLDVGEGGRYREGLRRVLRDAAEGEIVRTLMESERVPKDAKRPWSLMRGGRWVTVAYFNADLDEMSAQYEAFVRKIAADGNSSKIWRGESPLGE